MTVKQLSYQDISILQPITNDYLFDNKINHFTPFKPHLNEFKNAIVERNKFAINRNLLVRILQTQYANVNASASTINNIEALKSNHTFTVTTGHQLCLFTGPLYMVYKILSIIKLAQQLTEKHKDVKVIPVFWMATEDHDFDEINHCFAGANLKKFHWQKNAKGPVGRLSTLGLKSLINTFSEIFHKTKSQQFFEQLLHEAYNEKNSLAKATQILLNGLFGHYGLVIIDADHPELKKQLIPVLKEELFHQTTIHCVNQQLESFKQLGYNPQVNPRQINLFYMENGFRERIEKQGEIYVVLNTNVSFTAEELLFEIENFPEKFSPNVLLRPIYQETILPNIAYVGGGAELAYWLQLYPLFKSLKTFFPVLLMRDSALVLSQNVQKKLEQLNINLPQLFANKNDLLNQLIHQISNNNLQLTEAQQELENLYNQIATKALNIDKNLEKPIFGNLQKSKKLISSIEKKMFRAEKRKHDVVQNRLQKLYDEIFPNGSFQERKANVSLFYGTYGQTIFDHLLQNFDCTQPKVTVLCE